MEFLSLAVVVGSVGASALVSAKSEQIIHAIDDFLKSKTSSESRFLIDETLDIERSKQADLRLD